MLILYCSDMVLDYFVCFATSAMCMPCCMNRGAQRFVSTIKGEKPNVKHKPQLVRSLVSKSWFLCF